MDWTLKFYDQFTRDAKKVEKKHPNEFDAMFYNLEMYHKSLLNANKPSLIQHGFLHNEPMGIIAIDQTGGVLQNGKKRVKMKEMRLYTYSDLQSKQLHLICIGDKTSQPKDIQFSIKTVQKIQKESSAQTK